MSGDFTGLRPRSGDGVEKFVKDDAGVLPGMVLSTTNCVNIVMSMKHLGENHPTIKASRDSEKPPGSTAPRQSRSSGRVRLITCNFPLGKYSVWYMITWGEAQESPESGD